MRNVTFLLCALLLAGCQKAMPTWATVSVRDAATQQPLPAPLVAIQPQLENARGTRAAAKADDTGSARFMIEQRANYRVIVKAGPVTEEADLPPMRYGYDDTAWTTTGPDGAFEVRLSRDKHPNDPFAGLAADSSQ